MENEFRYFQEIPEAVGWVDGFVFLALCGWSMAFLQHLGVRREGSFFSARHRFYSATTLCCGVLFHAILLGGLNLFSLFQKNILFALLGGCWLVMVFSESRVLVEIPVGKRFQHLSHLLCATFSALAGTLLLHLRHETVGTRLYDNWPLVLLACLLLFLATAIAWPLSPYCRWLKKAPTNPREIVLPVAALLSLGLCWFWLFAVSQETVQIYRSRLLSIVSLGARTLRTEQVLRLRGLPEESVTGDYQSVAAALHHITVAFPEVRNSYLWTERGKNLIFLADGSQADLSQPGEVFRVREPGSEISSGPDIPYVAEPFYDRWGFWIAANHPIVDPATGKCFCWLGLDISACDYYLALGQARLQVMSFTGVFLLAIGLCHSHYRQISLSLDYERERQNIREKERQTLAGHLHDDLGQIITTLRLELAGKHTLQEDAIARLKNLLDTAGRRNRGAAFALAPYQSDLAQFSKELTHYIQECSTLLGLQVHLELPSSPFACASFEIAEHIIHILQESLTNVARHSRQTRASISLQRRARAWHLLVANDQRTPDAGAVHEDRPRLGLRLMEERIRQIGGECSFTHLTGGRAQLECRFPLSVFPMSVPSSLS